MQLTDKLKGKGWQPSRKEAIGLLAELATADRERAQELDAALRRLKAELPALALPAFDGAPPRLRARLVTLLEDTLAQPGERARLLSLLADDDAQTQRAAIAVLGRTDESVEPQLVAAWTRAENRRAIAHALGQIGTAASLSLLSEATDDKELSRIAGEARLKIERRTVRAKSAGAIRADVAPKKPLVVHFRCRRGIESVLLDELARFGGGEIVGPGRVAHTLKRSLSIFNETRTALDVALPLPIARGAERDDAVVAALTDPQIIAALQQFTDGPIRFRIEWRDAGKRRGETLRMAQTIAARAPSLLNDPTDSLWQVEVAEKPRLTIDLVPRALADTRFAYRQVDTVGASHPTLAAALARLGAPRPGDVVWDPFVGGATELIEVAKLCKEVRLIGSDKSAEARAHAQAALNAASLTAEIHDADALMFVPEVPPTLIITNPPMGRRVLNRTGVDDLIVGFFRRAIAMLAPGGRLVWLTPRGVETKKVGKAAGLALVHTARVDLGGFDSDLQLWEKAPARRK